MSHLESELRWRTQVMRAINFLLFILAAVIAVWIYAESTRPSGVNALSVFILTVLLLFLLVVGTPWYLSMRANLIAARQAVSKAKEINERHISP